MLSEEESLCNQSTGDRRSPSANILLVVKKKNTFLKKGEMQSFEGKADTSAEGAVDELHFER